MPGSLERGLQGHVSWVWTDSAQKDPHPFPILPAKERNEVVGALKSPSVDGAWPLSLMAFGSGWDWIRLQGESFNTNLSTRPDPVGSSESRLHLLDLGA